jgi:hypothetical protein
LADGSKISQQRTTLHAALQAALAEMPWRVHRTPPVNPAAPCVWIGPYVQMLDNVVIRISFPVVALYDGADHRQVDRLDDLGAVISDSIFRAGGRPSRSLPGRLDVGGPTLRSLDYQADFTAQGTTLCLPLLEVDDV